MKWLKQIIITVVALHVMFAPDVCLMLCCHASATKLSAHAIHDEADLPPCHRQQKAQPTEDAVSSLVVNAPCSHVHEEKPVAWQRAHDEPTWQPVLAAFLPTPFIQFAASQQRNLHSSFTSPTVSPPFRERNLPLRI